MAGAGWSTLPPARRRPGLGRVLLALGVVAAGAGVLVASQGSARAEGGPVPDPTPTPAPPDDVEALGRMLESETSSFSARVVIGWMTVQVAQRRKESVFQLLTDGDGYGAQLRKVAGKSKSYHASTAKDATDASRRLAAEILAGQRVPSREIRRHRPGPWVERKQGVGDERLLELQTKWDAGIYARVNGTRWVLYSSDAPVITLAPYASATERLDAVPSVPALDERPAVA